MYTTKNEMPTINILFSDTLKSTQSFYGAKTLKSILKMLRFKKIEIDINFPYISQHVSSELWSTRFLSFTYKRHTKEIDYISINGCSLLWMVIE